MFQAQGFGLSVIDVVMRVDQINVNQKIPVDFQLVQLGGVVPTALVVLSRLGISTGLITTFGVDELSKVLRDIIEKEKIIIKDLQEPSESTPLSIVVIDKNTGERTGFNARGVFPHIHPDAITDTLLDVEKLLIVDGHNPECTVPLIEQAHQKKTQVILDLGNPKHGMEELMKKADIVTVPQAYWRIIWPNSDPRDIVHSLLNKGVKTVILTMGDQGCWVGRKEEVFYQPAHIVKAVDTNGAGDVFMGAFCYGIINEWDMQKTALFATGAAGFSCTKYGKEKKIPNSLAEIYDFMKVTPLRTS